MNLTGYHTEYLRQTACRIRSLPPNLTTSRPCSLEIIRAMADKKPERVVFLDAGFALPDRRAGGNDQIKANAVQIFKTKGVTSFKTV